MWHLVKRTKESSSIEFRQATPNDAKVASRLLFDTFPRKATYIIGLGSEERAKKILARIFALSGHRLSYEHTELALSDGKVIGLLNSFPGAILGRLERKLVLYLLKQYRWRGKIALIRRGLPLVFIKEAANDAYFLSNIAVKKIYRGKGFGAQILRHVEVRARKSQLKILSLMVDIDNQGARRFYAQEGYKVKALHLESNKRVKQLGPGTARMEKILDGMFGDGVDK
jgi:ribosomal protein S18 acetylase RimI-like enzyme